MKDLEVKGKRKNVLVWVAAVAAIAALVISVKVLVHINSPAYRADQALRLGEHYLENLDYERAIVEFQKALELDSGNEEIAAAISAYIEEFLILAEDYGAVGNYSMERQMALYVLMLDKENERANALLADAALQEVLEQADRAFEDAHYVDAKDKYDKAVEMGAKDSDVNPNWSICNVYLELADLCETGEWDKVAVYIDSESFGEIKDHMGIVNLQIVSEKLSVTIEERDGSYCVISGSLMEGNISGKAVGVISSVNTYAIYAGSWSDYMPNGDGELCIWYKDENVSAGNFYTGHFVNGMLDGTAVLNTLVDSKAADFDIAVSEGSVSVFTTDKHGNVWLCDAVDDGIYVLDDVSVVNGMVTGFKIGVPGFGGSDARLSVSLLNLNMPVPSIPENAYSWKSHYYAIFDSAASWEDAEAYCESLGGHLATITSNEENIAVFSFVIESGYQNAYFGLSDNVTEGSWYWITGEPVEYMNWHSGEPNAENPNEDYAMYYYKFADGSWNDGDFGGRTVNGGVAFICEWD